MIGSRDSEHGPKLVKSPPLKTINNDKGVGSVTAPLINCSPLRAKSESAREIAEIALSPLCF